MEAYYLRDIDKHFKVNIEIVHNWRTGNMTMVAGDAVSGFESLASVAVLQVATVVRAIY